MSDKNIWGRTDQEKQLLPVIPLVGPAGYSKSPKPVHRPSQFPVDEEQSLSA